MLRSSQLTFVEAEEALKMNPGGDVRPKLSVKNTVVLLKYGDAKSSSQYAADSWDWACIINGFINMNTILRKHLLIKVRARWLGATNPWPKTKDCRCKASIENLKLMQLD